MSIWNYVMISSAALMTVLILIQVRGASLGAGLGGGGEVNTVRRGSDKSLFNLTIVCAVAFSLSIILEIILA
ncbi:MAG TPA: preprotein translocase subunit SecG [Candidatus Saccharibacteria bacterium]|nr:preprotein translocase subunit SecG [Candidatus Saccharibacteria bacterium]HMT55891.1 preprotein translocase subunit SecG [Candidatus Saccharibacteria bacterium]